MILFLFRKGESRRENEYILRVMKEEVIDEALFVQEIHNSGDEENND